MSKTGQKGKREKGHRKQPDYFEGKMKRLNFQGTKTKKRTISNCHTLAKKWAIGE